MRRYFIHLGSGNNACIVDIANFVYYDKDMMSYHHVINGFTDDTKKLGITVKYETKEERDKDFHRLFIATQEYNLDEIHNLRQTKGSEE